MNTLKIETRNRIIHGYDTVSDEILWSIVTTRIPVLRQEMDSLLECNIQIAIVDTFKKIATKCIDPTVKVK